MPELRQDPVIGRWVIISIERARRPGNFIDPIHRRWRDNDEYCDLCCAKPDEQICKVGDVCVVPSRQSSQASGQQALNPNGQDGLYEVIRNVGIHETVIETPEHVSNMADLPVGKISEIIQTYVARFDEIEKNTSLTHVLVYKNYGLSQFAHHACSHIMATPVPSLEITEKLSGAQQYFKQHKRCVYCDLIQQELRDKKRIVAENDSFLAVIPFAARFLFETWVLPKKHHADFARGVRGCEEDLAVLLKTVLQKFKNGLDDTAYNWVIQTAPFRRHNDSGGKWQTIAADYHWHVEIIPRLTRMAGFEKGSGFYICAIPPEGMAEYLREVEI